MTTSVRFCFSYDRFTKDFFYFLREKFILYANKYGPAHEILVLNTGFIGVREMSGKFKFFQGQGIVREFYVVSVKNEYLLKCQGNVREFYNFHFVSKDEKQKNARQFS